jgi:hypothetical protein
VKAELEEEKPKNADLDSKNADLDSKVTHLEIESLGVVELASPPPCENRVVHKEHYKWLQQDQQMHSRTRGGKRKTEGSDGDDGDGGSCGGLRW